MLTPSEDVIVRQLVGTALTQNVARVRAIVARPDLTPDESAAAMSHALTPVAFTDSRVAFLQMLVFGAGSQASRSVLATAVTRGLLARADAIYDRSPTFDAPSDAAAELFRIYAFLGGDVANAGTPQAGHAHDAQIGIDAATYETCAKALGDHLKRHAAYLQPGSQLSPIATRIRAQAMLAAFDMGAESPTRVIDGADRIGLDASRRPMLLERNLLVLESGKSPQALAAATALVRRFRPSAIDQVEGIYFGDDHPGLRAHGAIIAIKNELDATARMDGFPPDEVSASPVSAALADLALQLALAVSKRALATHGDLRLAVERDARAAGGDARKLLGPAADSSPEAVAAGSVRMLLSDAPRSLDLAMARFLAGRPESVALASDALGVLAASAGPDGVQSLVLGKGEADGTSSPLALSVVRLNPNGTAASFTLAGNHWEIVRGDTGAVTGVHRDGQPLAFAMLTTARIPVAGGTGWNGGGLVLSPLYGSPLVGVVPGPRIRIVGQGDLDVASIQAPGDDVAFDADVRSDGTFAVLLRAKGGKDGVGIGLRVTPGSPTKVSIVNTAADGAEHELAQSTALGSVEHIHVEIHGNTIRATCTHRTQPPQTASLEAPVPAHQAHGDVALVVKKGVSVELDAVTLRRN
jgi:hypothetical protein